MKREELIKKYLEFFKSKDHKVIPSSSLIPKDDPSVLFTTAGMHPLVPFLLGQKHPLGKRLVNIQKCIRTGDIEEVGDESHHTFFEMLGNWSLGDYWKKDSIKYSFEFLTKILKIPKEKITITCFKGDKNAKKDTEAAESWKLLGITKIKFLGKKDNWWGPAGKIGPCGPDTEIFINNFEIWNNVFIQYNKDAKANYKPAKQKNIDTGMGVERTLTILNNLNDNYLTELWTPIIKEIEKLSKKSYSKNKKEMRIIADHLKASVFILGDGVLPCNTEHGYVLRRLIRRAIRYKKELKINESITKIAEPVFKIYPNYPELTLNKQSILRELKREEQRFEKTLEKGLNKFKKFTKNKRLSGKESFLLYQSYGFPIEMIEEECKKNKIKFSKKEFEIQAKKHQKLSRTATEGKFKSGLSDHSEQTTKLHTAAHLLLAALRKTLKDENIIQKGSNITPERLRLDFSFPRKLTEREIQKAENLVNIEIQKAQKVTKEDMSPEEAKKKKALGSFSEKYGDIISVFSIGNFSKEICTGPHVPNTQEIGQFKIIKQQSSSSGVRRIKAIIK